MYNPSILMCVLNRMSFLNRINPWKKTNNSRNALLNQPATPTFWNRVKSTFTRRTNASATTNVKPSFWNRVKSMNPFTRKSNTSGNKPIRNIVGLNVSSNNEPANIPSNMLNAISHQTSNVNTFTNNSRNNFNNNSSNLANNLNNMNVTLRNRASVGGRRRRARTTRNRSRSSRKSRKAQRRHRHRR